VESGGVCWRPLSGRFPGRIRDDDSFDVLAACRQLFERHPDVPVLSKVNDYDTWSWKLADRGPPIEPGVRSVNRLSTHFIAYDVARFVPVAERFGGFDLDVFIDRLDLSYNWEDLVSHVGVTGDRRIAFPEPWPLDVYHCDRKGRPRFDVPHPAARSEGGEPRWAGAAVRGSGKARVTTLVSGDVEQDTSRSRAVVWRRLLEGSCPLSPRYRARYAVVLTHLERRASSACVSAARTCGQPR